MINSLEKNIAFNIRTYRQKRHFTQEALAERVGISVRMISLIENNKVGIHCNIITKMAAVFEIDPHKLILPPHYAELENLSPEVNNLIPCINRLSADKVQLLTLLVHTWIKGK